MKQRDLKEETAQRIIVGLLDLIKKNKIAIPNELKYKINAYAYLFDEEEVCK